MKFITFRLIPAAMLVLALALPCAAALGKVQLPKMKSEVFEAYGFEVDVPKTSVRHVLPTDGQAELVHLYSFGDLIYLVSITKTPPDSIAPTAIEQNLQGMVASATVVGATKRWESSSKHNELFKGVSRIFPGEEIGTAEAPIIQKALRGREPVESICSAGLEGDSGPILAIGVIGPKGRDAEIEGLAKMMAYSVSRLGKTAPAADVLKAAPREQIAPAGPAKLKKGDIELMGVVQALNARALSIIMVVSRIRMPSGAPITLDPVRQKTVYLKSVPSELTPGKAVQIMGKNTGIGKAMTADRVDVIADGTPVPAQENNTAPPPPAVQPRDGAPLPPPDPLQGTAAPVPAPLLPDNAPAPPPPAPPVAPPPPPPGG